MTYHRRYSHAPMYALLYTPSRIAPLRFRPLNRRGGSRPPLSPASIPPSVRSSKFGLFDALRRLLFSHPTQRAAPAPETANDHDLLRPAVMVHPLAHPCHAGKSNTILVLRRPAYIVESYHFGSTQTCAVIWLIPIWYLPFGARPRRLPDWYCADLRCDMMATSLVVRSQGSFGGLRGPERVCTI